MTLSVYRANFHSQDTSTHGQPNSIQFGADDASSDAHASAFASGMAALGGGKLTTITKRIDIDFSGVPYPTGTKNTANVLISDAYGGKYRSRFRNCLTTTSKDDLAALFGAPPAGYGGSVVAYGASPTLPNTGQAVAIVNGSNLARY